MEKQLNIENLKKALEKNGFSQSSLADKLGVSREAVSKWLSGNKFPRPDKLLRLGLALGLGVKDIVTQVEDAGEPVIAFRKRGNIKITNDHIAHAKNMGKMLSVLVPYLPFNLLVQPATLKDPNCNYEYIQRVVKQIRSEIAVGPNEVLKFHHIIKKFDELQAVLIPVMWGEKEKHENALHIYLPDSMTTWVYLNLDVNAHDFKFWMAHELGHIHTPHLRGNEAEDFADKFAGALIFPESLAEEAYKNVTRSRTEKSQITKIKRYAERFDISLVSVYYEINKYAKHYGLNPIEAGNNLYAINTNFNKKFYNVRETILEGKKPDAKHYISACKTVFNTPFFGILKSFLAEQRKSAGFVQCILDTPLLDAKGIHAELS